MEKENNMIITLAILLGVVLAYGAIVRPILNALSETGKGHIDSGNRPNSGMRSYHRK